MTATSTQVMPARINQPPFVNNLLVNPGFEIWQRGISVVTASGMAPTLDEWFMRNSVGPAVTVARDATEVTHGPYSAKVTTGASQQCNLRQGIEAYKSLEGQWLTFSVDIKSDTTVYIEIQDWTGTYEQEVVQYTGAGEWQRVTVSKLVRTGLVPYSTVIPHDFGLMVNIPINNAGATYVDSAVLAAGYFPEGVPYVPLHPAEDWERCLRYYHTSSGVYDSPVWSGMVTTGYTYDRSHQFPTVMYATPTITWLSGGQSGFAAGTPTYFPGPRGLWMRKVATSTGGSGYHYAQYTAEVP